MIMNRNTNITFATMENSRRFNNKTSWTPFTYNIILIFNFALVLVQTGMISFEWDLFTCLRLFWFFNFYFGILRNWICLVTFIHTYTWYIDGSFNLNFWWAFSWSPFLVQIISFMFSFPLFYVKNQFLLIDNKFFSCIISWKQTLTCISSFSWYDSRISACCNCEENLL